MNTPPFARFEWLIAGRYLRARRRERTISAIVGFSLVGIMLGVATLIIVMSVMNGFRDTLVDRILGVGAHVMALPAGGALDDPEAAAVRVAALPGVTRAAAMLEGQVMASGPGGASGVILRAYPADDLRSLPAIAAPEEALGDPADIGANRVAVAWGLAQQLGVARGDTLTLISPNGLSTPFGRSIRSRSYEVAYVFRIGMHEYDKAFVYMDLPAAQLFLNREGAVSGLEIMVDRPDDVERFAQPIRDAIGARAPLWTWKQANGAFLDALAIERNTMFIILTLIILVAALNIISGLIMLVKDKERDIGILRTMGLARGSVLRVFFICGASIGVVGTLLGVALGVAFTLNIRTIQGWVEAVTGGSVWDPSIRVLSQIPADLRASDVLTAAGLALALSFLATLYPAWRAARLDPVEALRHE
ncbi:lipoprotein-releasing ABC transporter permease subunit [Rubrimonas cliftonensis]|uniref:Lipoprotein-releasing system permease protein n=1 Tax=Rubrimonas cliftonensis TaxID=89524 RepID=A0A1H3ZFD9_9RHOB|nr:lipoprotein-releasing ABC transporter permease subunit [Rubrimonas cliftonensis]SEA22032.1 lipoprotein-releasing system permease protein [Rubrimonas cliftonensis]